MFAGDPQPAAHTEPVTDNRAQAETSTTRARPIQANRFRPTLLDPVPGDELPSSVRTMSDPEPQQASVAEPTLKELIARAEPMGDLKRFIIDDLTEADEDAFFEILANA